MQNTNNKDRHLCKICKWRSKNIKMHNPGCDYYLYHKTPRIDICTVEECTVFEKGDKYEGFVVLDKDGMTERSYMALLEGVFKDAGDKYKKALRTIMNYPPYSDRWMKAQQTIGECEYFFRNGIKRYCEFDGEAIINKLKEIAKREEEEDRAAKLKPKKKRNRNNQEE